MISGKRVKGKNGAGEGRRIASEKETRTTL
jgi:hypothetical protein